MDGREKAEMEKVVNIGRKALAWLLSAMLVVGWGGGFNPRYDAAAGCGSGC